TSVTGAPGMVWTATYDSQGRVQTWQAPTFGSQQQEHRWYYDAEGRVSKIEWKYYPNPAGSSGASQSSWIAWEYGYDNMGNVLQEKKDLGGASGQAVCTYEYDADHNLKKSVDPDLLTGEILYDERDLVWKTTMAKGTAVET